MIEYIRKKNSEVHPMKHVYVEFADETLVTFCPTIKPEEEKIDVNSSSLKIRGLIRALSDKPGAFFFLEGVKIKVYKCEVIEENYNANVGQIVKADKNGLYFKTADSAISILELQKEGKNRMDYKSFINGNANLLGKYFE